MKLLTKSFTSQYLGKEYRYQILTADEVKNELYVLFVHDGKDYLEIGSLKRAFQNLLEKNRKEASKLLFILLHPGDSMERWNTYKRGGKYFSDYLTFFTNEFVPKIEDELKKLNIKIGKTGLLGDSLAGNISLNAAMKSPEKWSHLLLQSAAISEDDIKKLKNFERLPWNVYQIVGNREDEYISLIDQKRLYILTRNRKLHQVLKKKTAYIDYKETDSDHEWKLWEKDLPKALAFFTFK